MNAYKGNTITYEKGADVALGNPKFVEETKINILTKAVLRKRLQ